MQDDKTAQSDTKDSSSDDKKDLTHESTLSLGANPSDQSSQPDSSAPAPSTDSPSDDSPADNSAAPAADPPAGDDSSSDGSQQTETKSPASDQATAPSGGQSGDLQSIRSQALKELTPIVGELDQEPAEKFRTLMMLIQSSDDQKLIKEAYDTAEKITDNKLKAEALLAIVDEINYFTAKDEKSED